MCLCPHGTYPYAYLVPATLTLVRSLPLAQSKPTN